MPTVANKNSHKFGKQCGMYVAKMQDFAQKQTPGFVISVTKKVHKKVPWWVKNLQNSAHLYKTRFFFN